MDNRALQKNKYFWTNYLQLIRFDKPVGTILLWLPTAWALWIANKGMPSLNLIFYFFIGTFIMRSAGCIINDLADREIDKHVSRTKNRPLAAGSINITKAFLMLIILLALALLIVSKLPIACFYYSFFALFITFLYPFCKRFFEAPQFILGFAFSMGIPMAIRASNASFDKISFILLLINFLWIVSYDTMYALADRKEDLKIGVNSTAILFGIYTDFCIKTLQSAMHFLWLYIAIMVHFKIGFYVCWLLAISVLYCQQKLIKKKDSASCMQAFSISIWYGSFMWLGIILGYGRFI